MKAREEAAQRKRQADLVVEFAAARKAQDGELAAAKKAQEEEAKRQVDKEKSLLEQLAEMGFTDKQHNTSLLRQMRYDMDHAFSEHALR